MCGTRLDDAEAAAAHQIGDHLQILRRHNRAACSRELIDLVAERAPERWVWWRTAPTG
ncbi:hypothetical protein GFY24_28300 [Nocardia sp. SYP-A9097]|uniref:hypothetical protein n=1 Tax=Nocardia sp. SYP-A9097 TaxID=2663237 RepID=UPI00129B10D9|nr:hypothetical protein [Nocardia sp. SYP-A9097]MRH91299.1 hypothetical protein [Nocardia sp. SYP-A9097]